MSEVPPILAVNPFFLAMAMHFKAFQSQAARDAVEHVQTVAVTHWKLEDRDHMEYDLSFKNFNLEIADLVYSCINLSEYAANLEFEIHFNDAMEYEIRDRVINTLAMQFETPVHQLFQAQGVAEKTIYQVTRENRAEALSILGNLVDEAADHRAEVLNVNTQQQVKEFRLKFWDVVGKTIRMEMQRLAEAARNTAILATAPLSEKHKAANKHDGEMAAAHDVFLR